MADVMDVCYPNHENPLKRSLVDNNDHDGQSTSTSPANKQNRIIPTPPLTSSPNEGDANRRDPSPAPSSSTLSSIAASTQDQPSGPTAQPAQKKRKLTSAEKEQQRIESEQRKLEKAEQKTRRDEEKRIKDEEKRRKREEKEAKDREKELEKQRRVEEKEKKERSQMKLTFFAKPKLPTVASPTPAQAIVNEPCTDTGMRRSPSAEPVETPDLSSQVTPKPRATGKSDYERKFLPFQLPSHSRLAPYITHATDDMETSQQEFDSILDLAVTGKYNGKPQPVCALYNNSKSSVPRGIWQPNAREVMDSLNGSSQNPIDLTDENGELYRREDLLQSITVRYLHFAEDVRPPYYGSYTKALSPRSSAKVRRNPFSRVRKDTNYDYDSEAEWEEPEEGEDILSDGEEDEESVGTPDEMEDFLDDEEEGGPKRRLITGDLKPVSTGICWEDSSGDSAVGEDVPVDLASMKLSFFMDLPTQSINPFSATYWSTKENPPAQPPPPPLFDTKPVLQLDKGKMVSPRASLQPRTSTTDSNIIGAASGMKGPIMAVGPTKSTKPAVKPLHGTDLDEFKEAVVGSNIAKTELVKALKKRFPQHTHEIIKATLSDCFTFSGVNRGEKKWIFSG